MGRIQTYRLPGPATRNTRSNPQLRILHVEDDANDALLGVKSDFGG